MILHQTKQRVIIATGLDRPSKNPKTGDMIQVWIIRNDIDPVSASRTGKDVAICGECALRGDGHGNNRSCYVTLAHGPLAIFKKARRKAYPTWGGDASVFAGKMIRWGAYGDPAYIPFHILRDASEASAGWTGYTHQWRNPLFQPLKDYLMASADTQEDALAAWGMGWRTFRAGPSPIYRMEIECVNTSHGKTCAECRLCAGNSKPAKSIWIRPHGMGANLHPSIS